MMGGTTAVTATEPERQDRSQGSFTESPSGTSPCASAVEFSAPDVALACVCVGIAFGALYAGPMFRALAAQDLQWSLEAVAGAFAVGSLVTIPTGFLASSATDRWGALWVMTWGMATCAVALVTAAGAHALWQWFATAGILLAVGVRTVLAGTSVLASRRQRRGRSLGLTYSAIGGGLTVGPPAVQVLLEAWGWRMTLLAMGLLFATLTLVTGVRAQTTVVGGRAATATKGEFGGTRLDLLVGFFIGNVLLGIYDEVVYQHTYAHGLALGLTGTVAAAVIGGVSAAYTAGGFTGGVLSDIRGRRPVLVGSTIAAAATLLLMAVSDAASLWVWGAAFGFVLGMGVAVRSAAWADAFAGPRLGRDVGIVSTGYSVGAAIATYGGASWLDRGGSFPALYITGAAVAVLWAFLGAYLTGPVGSCLRKGDGKAQTT